MSGTVSSVGSYVAFCHLLVSFDLSLSVFFSLHDCDTEVNLPATNYVNFDHSVEVVAASFLHIKLFSLFNKYVVRKYFETMFHTFPH